MAERVVSPGVFTNEVDASFLPAAIGEIGACIIGTSKQGPMFVPTVVESISDFKIKFGGMDKNHFMPYAAKSYLKNAGKCTVVRIGGKAGYTSKGMVIASDGGQILALIQPSGSGNDFAAADGVITGNSGSHAFNLSIGGVVSPTMSMIPSDANYIGTVLGKSPTGAGLASEGKNGYVSWIFEDSAALLETTVSVTSSVIEDSTTAFTNGYSSAKTPFICSQTGSADASTGYGSTNLFKFETLSHGQDANTNIKVSIQNVKGSGAVAGTDYGTFDVVIRKFGDTDKRQEVLETFAGCNLDPASSKYIVRVIGDMKETFDTTTSKVTVSGNYPVKSKYVRLSDVNEALETLSEHIVPFGFKSLSLPVSASFTSSYGGAASHGAVYKLPSLPVITTQTGSDGEVASYIHHGVDFDGNNLDSYTSKHKDLLPYLGPTPTTTYGSSSLQFGLDKDIGLSPSGSESVLSAKKFSVPFAGGYDGFDPRYIENQSGKGSYQTADSSSYWDAITTVSNPDELDINMLVIPGINKGAHSNIYTKARDAVEERADSFFVFDAGGYTDGITTVVDAVQQEDTSYAATYYPWVKIFDDENNIHVWVPPSTVLPGVIAFNDKVSHSWFAPAGLNRGGLTEVIMAADRLTQANRDTLYEGRVNPIATFPGEGVCVWGQKTLQSKASALDRINVRRLLITLKKFIASTSRYLVFEQNTNATRNRFLNIVNPYLETVQSNSGLSAFRVVMDETNNTSDVIDRNQLQGQIFIQPTRTAEFIVLDFIVQSTGAAFPE